MSDSPDTSSGSEGLPVATETKVGKGLAEKPPLIYLARQLQERLNQPARTEPKPQPSADSTGETHKLRKCMQDYFKLAEEFWRASAADQVGEFYKKKGEEIDELKGKLYSIRTERRRWRRRRYDQALTKWRDSLESNQDSLDIAACGEALYFAQGMVGLACMPSLAYRLLQFQIVLCGIFSLLAAGWFLTIVLILRPDDLNTTLLKTVIFLPYLLSLFWIIFSPPRLNVLIGYMLAKAAFGKEIIQWSTVIFSVLVFVIDGLLVTIFALYEHASAVSFDLQDLQKPYPLMQLLVLVPTTTFIFLLPFTVLLQIRLWANLLGAPERIPGSHWLRSLIANLSHWIRSLPRRASSSKASTHEDKPRSAWVSPQVRGAGLHAALRITWLHSVLLLFVAYEIIAFTDPRVGRGTIFTISVPLTNITILVGRQVIFYVLALILPYVLLIEWPYRWGVKRWRAEKLRKLEQTRSSIAGHLNSAFGEQPVPGEPFTIEDYYKWEYYGKQIDEVNAVSAGPYSLAQRIRVIGLGIVGGLLLDQLKNLLDLLIPQIPH